MILARRFAAPRAKPYPPEGETSFWRDRIKNALGTASSPFVEASLIQLQVAARLPCSGISEVGLSAALAMIEAAAPKDEIEGALAVQMACTHAAGMAILGRVGGAHGTDRNVAARVSAAARLLRPYATQVETLRRLRNGSSQLMRIEHVHVNQGGQAVIGNISRSGE